jgi:glycosyltransferase involved in cell wall biosynthesis
MANRKKLAYLVSHPIQYQTPLFRYITEHASFDFKAFFLNDFSTREYTDPGFKQPVKWDVPLLGGYEHEFIPSFDPVKAAHVYRPFTARVSRIFRNNDIDAIWTHGYHHPAFLRALYLARRKGVKTMVRNESRYGSVYGEGTKSRDAKSRFLNKRLFPVTDAFLAIGSENKKYYLRHGVPEEKIFDVPYAVDNSYFQNKIANAPKGRKELREELNVSEDAPVIVFVGKFIGRKRPLDLVKAWGKLVTDSEGVKPYLVMVGSGPLHDEAVKLANSIDQEHVRMVGFKNVEEVPGYYALGDLFVIPSEAEPWGLVTNEAMNAGVPIIATNDIGSSADLVREGENGYVIDVGDIDAMASAIRKVLSDKETAEQMGRRSLELINQHSYREDLEGLEKAMAAVFRK